MLLLAVIVLPHHFAHVVHTAIEAEKIALSLLLSTSLHSVNTSLLPFGVQKPIHEEDEMKLGMDNSNWQERRKKRRKKERGKKRKKEEEEVKDPGVLVVIPVEDV